MQRRNQPTFFCPEEKRLSKFVEVPVVDENFVAVLGAERNGGINRHPVIINPQNVVEQPLQFRSLQLGKIANPGNDSAPAGKKPVRPVSVIHTSQRVSNQNGLVRLPKLIANSLPL